MLSFFWRRTGGAGAPTGIRMLSHKIHIFTVTDYSPEIQSSSQQRQSSRSRCRALEQRRPAGTGPLGKAGALAARPRCSCAGGWGRAVQRLSALAESSSGGTAAGWRRRSGAQPEGLRVRKDGQGCVGFSLIWQHWLCREKPASVRRRAAAEVYWRIDKGTGGRGEE
jgi:hypothetical protein